MTLAPGFHLTKVHFYWERSGRITSTPADPSLEVPVWSVFSWRACGPTYRGGDGNGKLLLVEDFSLIPAVLQPEFSSENCGLPHGGAALPFGRLADIKEVLNAAISQADVCNKSSRSGELYSIWHVRLLLQVGIKTKKAQHIQEQPATN